MNGAVNEAKISKSDEQLKELVSLARLVAFARQSAKELNADFPAYCLDLALGALMQDIHGDSIDTIGEDQPRLQAAAAVVH